MAGGHFRTACEITLSLEREREREREQVNERGGKKEREESDRETPSSGQVAGTWSVCPPCLGISIRPRSNRTNSRDTNQMQSALLAALESFVGGCRGQHVTKKQLCSNV